MILDTVRDEIALWEYAERYLGGGTRTYSPFAADMDIDDKYHPQRGQPTFDLPTFWVPDHAGAYLAGPTPTRLVELYREPGRLLLPVHPQTLGAVNPADRAALTRLAPGPAFTVTPSANARTVFVRKIDGQAVPPHCVKLHYPRRLSRFTRRLRRPIITLQLWVAAELTRVGVAILPEVGGGVFGTDPRAAWGYLLRELRTAGGVDSVLSTSGVDDGLYDDGVDSVSAGGGGGIGAGVGIGAGGAGGAGGQAPGWRTVPLFALYGTDLHEPDHPTVLEQLIADSGQSVVSFLTERLVRPMVRMWLTAALSTGCALEMHGQNTLFTFTTDLRRTRVVYRDCAIYVDPALRAALGLPSERRDLPPANVIGWDVRWPREQVFSLAYDSFTGHHALAYLARLAERRFGVPVAELQEVARHEFAQRPGAADLLAETVHYYDDQIHPDGDWALVDTGQKPAWR